MNSSADIAITKMYVANKTLGPLTALEELDEFEWSMAHSYMVTRLVFLS